MESRTEQEAVQRKRSFRKGPGLLIAISIIGFLCFLGIVLWVNWSKPKIHAEPLSPELKTVIGNLPGKSDALIYIGLKDIRESRLWKEVIPDSLKKAPLFRAQGRLDTLMKAAAINPSEDLDTLLLSFRRTGYKEQNFICLAWGPFRNKLSRPFLIKNSRSVETIGGSECFELGRNLWLASVGPRKIAFSSSRKMLEGFLLPSGSFYRRDSLTTALIDKAVYKSHLWFALPSAVWTEGALQSLTSANSDVKTVGNVNSIEHLALSLKLNDGIEAESEWIYPTRRAAFFASSFLWGALQLSEISGTRTSPEIKQLLGKIRVRQNLESVVITADIPIDLFRHAAPGMSNGK
ncbi:MAG: hypothetical protein HGA62_07550 [Chlorobiaceae bacterium]|nr:hypothetical protein [Chlorobiaceae bacterium]NTV60939.1 hypothetical protein [Chlorobiaceae bacterium]